LERRFWRHGIDGTSIISPLSQHFGSFISWITLTARWEKFRFYHFPTAEELEAVSKVMEMDAEELVRTLPTKDQPMKLEPIRLCAACYKEQPYHRLEWQFQSTKGCDRHKLRLLSQCPSCGERFPPPAEWVEGKCNKCGMKFSSMAKKQKPY
jgi:hypothetical protein